MCFYEKKIRMHIILFLNNLCQGRVEEIVKQAGAELGQAQLKLGLDLNKTKV